MTARLSTEGRLTSFGRDGLVFDVVDQGPLAGDVVVLLHGFPQRCSSWDLLAPLSHASGYRTPAPDQRGYSPRARPRGRISYRMPFSTSSQLAEVTVPALFINSDSDPVLGRTGAEYARRFVTGRTPSTP